MQYAMARTEAADIFILGAILPVIATLAGRRVHYWLETKKYPNIWSMLGGKPADRKSGAIAIAKEIAEFSLGDPSSFFLPNSFSPESLFEEYWRFPEKLWMPNDANPILINWQKTPNGERNAAGFLPLYDCCGLVESFMRNKNKKDPKSNPRREIPETYTNIAFPATYSAAQFQGQQHRAGLDRRFNFSVADVHGRVIERPKHFTLDEFNKVLALFKPLQDYSGEIDFADKKTHALWAKYQNENRDQLTLINYDCELDMHRWGAAPKQMFTVAALFQLCCSAKHNPHKMENISYGNLRLAHDYILAHLEGAKHLDLIANRAVLEDEWEMFILAVRENRKGKECVKVEAGWIYYTRTQLSKRFANNTGREHAITPRRLFNEIIPMGIAKGEARMAVPKGQRSPEVYALML